jgi:glycine/D-amino acid oxidase-like deaminating enzyme
MKTHTRVAVIGGGVVGCSVLYHLTKAGWKDVVLLERDQLTSGSTWHAAGGFHTLNGDPNVAKLQGYTIGLYDELEKISGQSCGLHRSGGLLLADTPERMEWLKMAHARARYLGLETELLTAREARDLLPLIEDKYFVGAMLDKADGNLDPYGTTHAYAKSARIGGAQIYLQTRVTAITRRADGTWDLATDKGTINAEHVVNAGGLWAREVGRMVGLELPVLAMEHMYLVTDDMPEVIAYNKERGCELPHAIDFRAEIYMRQERSGMVLGTYEKACVPWQPRQTPWDFGRIAAAGPGSDPAVAGNRLPAFPRHGEGGHPAHHQRPVHLLPRRQSARGSRAGPARVLVRLRRDGRLQPGRRRRTGAVAVDGGRRSRASMYGRWTWHATASGRPAATPTRRCARTIRAASRSASPTRSCRPRVRSRPPRSTT